MLRTLWRELNVWLIAPVTGPQVFWPPVTTQVPTPQAVRDELARVLASAAFVRSDRQSHFLRFIVEGSLEGRHVELKESVIGVEVFGRAPGYDPKIDGVVRTEAVRLRSRLDRYYTEEGRDNLLIIELPKGGYRPVFRLTTSPDPPVLEGTPDDARVHADERRSAVAPLPQPRRFPRWVSAVGATILMAAGAGSWLWWHSERGAPVTIAVLPFDNVGHDAAVDYVAEGLTDELINSLSVIEGLTVRSRTSSFALRDRRLTAAEAGRQLRAAYLVEGAVQHVGEQLRVTLDIVDAGDDTHLSTLRFDRKLTDVFSLQEEISRAVVSSLRLKLTTGRRRYETNVDAYEMYLRGRHAMEGFPARGHPIAQSAVRFFDQAIEKDANYAIAYAGKADALLAIDENMVDAKAYEEARAAADRAVVLDPMLSEALSVRGALRAREYAWVDAEADLRRATALNTNNALAHLRLGLTLVLGQGRAEEGLNEARRAASLDPLSPYVRTEVGRALFFAGNYEEAASELQKAIQLDGSRNRPYMLRARTLAMQGKMNEALTVLEQAPLAPRRGSTKGSAVQVCLYSRAGRSEDAAAFVRETLQRDVPARYLAEMYACSGDVDQALAYLRKAIADREPGLADIVRSPELPWMRSDARVAPMFRQLHIKS